jgi:hypothetical protein
LSLAEGAQTAKGGRGDATVLSEQIKMVAGTRNRRSHHSTVPI